MILCGFKKEKDHIVTKKRAYDSVLTVGEKSKCGCISRRARECSRRGGSQWQN